VVEPNEPALLLSELNTFLNFCFTAKNPTKPQKNEKKGENPPQKKHKK